MTACDAVHMVLDQQETVRRVEEQLKVQRKLPAAREQRGSGESIEGKELVAAAGRGSSTNTRQRRGVWR